MTRHTTHPPPGLRLLAPASSSSSLLYVILLCGALFGATGARMNSGEARDLLDRVFVSLEKMIGIFESDYSSVNVDGLFGFRVGQGSVNQSLADCAKPGFRCPNKMLHRLQRINNEIETISSHATPYVEAQDEEYFKHFFPLIDGPYILHYKTEVIQHFDWPAIGNRRYDEEKGDMCLSLLIGSYQNEPKCSVTDECWKFMTESNTHGYVSTHQLIYFIIADKNDCLDAFTARLRSIGQASVRDHETELCSRILSDATRLEHKGRVNILRQDLFLEQSLLCSILGFQNFITPEWVRMALSWQNDHGCYSMIPSVTAVESEILHLRGEERKLLRLMKQEAKNIDQLPAPTGRKLMREKIMKGDCLAHKTGLAFGLVGAYIRHFVRELYAPAGFNQ